VNPGWRKRCVFWVLLLAGTVGVMELMVRIALPPPGLYGDPADEDNQLAEPHPVRGYALRPHAVVSGDRTGRIIEYRINERGFRDGPMARTLEAPLRLLAVGDSFTMGLRVAAEDSWPERLEALLREGGRDARVLNAGVPGYSARQMRQALEELLPEMQPRVVLFGLYALSFWRVEAPYTLFDGQLVTSTFLWRVRSTDDGLLIASRFVPRRMQGLDFWLRRHLHLGAYLLDLAARAGRQLRPSPARELSEEERLAPVFLELEEARRLAEQSDRAFVVVVISKQEEDGRISERERRIAGAVATYCREHGISVVDPTDELARASGGKPIFRFENDFHWNAEAHRLVARLVYEHLEGAGLDDGPGALLDERGSAQGPARPAQLFYAARPNRRRTPRT
jgi:lysophospholipase L1-like esterase